MPLVKIDDVEFEVEAGTTVLEACRSQGIEIPYYCYHPALEIVGSCRMCLVQVEGMSRLQTSCSTIIGEMPPERKVDGKFDMVVRTGTEVVRKERENVLEFLLINHPLDCPVCDQAGECYLQDYSFEYGKAHSRFREAKRVRPNEYLGSKIVINHNRCIMCSRCVRFTREISGTGELFVESRGSFSRISVMEEMPLDNLLAGNVADICPVGALLSTDYIHKNRIWNLSKQPSVCTDCSVGCNIDVYFQGHEIYRVNPRENAEVNEHFMCDVGRYGFHRYEEVDRVTAPLIRSGDSVSEISWEGALTEIFHHFTKARDGEKQKIAAIASPFHTNETNFLLGQFMHELLKGRGYLGILPSIQVEEDVIYPSGFRISRDRSPNRQGVQDLCQPLEEDILATVRKRKTRIMYVLDDGVDREGEDRWVDVLRNLRFMVVQTYAMTPLARLAHLILPGPAPFEREGTMTNDQGRVQWLRPSLSLQGRARPDWAILMEVMNTVGKRELHYSEVGEVMKAMGELFPAYAGITFFRLGELGLPRNGRPEEV